MLTAEQIEVLGDKAQQIISSVTEFLISDIAKRISQAGQLTSTASYQTWRLQQLGISQRQLKKELRKRLKVSHRELRKLLSQAAETGYNFDIQCLPYVQAVPFARNAVLQQIFNSALQMTEGNLHNITETIGFVTRDGIWSPLTEAYRKSCDFAFMKVSTGAQDYNSAIREATRNLAEKGIQVINYESGVHTALEAAVRRNIMGGLGLMQEQISRQNHDDFGCDGWEISAHAASAPDHEPIQGKQYSDAEYEKLNDSLVRRIGTLNCGHAAFPIILGVSTPQYTPEELEKMRVENEKGITYNGKHYTMYEATQCQRQIEREIRRQKRKILVDEAAGDKEKLQTDQIRYQILNQEYKRFCKAAGLRLQHERMGMTDFGPKQAREAETVAGNVFKNPPKDLNRMSQMVDKALDKQSERESKWSGTTIIQPRDSMPGIAGRKEWSCDITLREDVGIKTVIHEHLHARSASYYDPKTYIKNRKLEEGAVELFAQEICKLNGIKFSCAYVDYVKPLQISNSIMRIGDGYSFAKQLFDIPLPERYNWLRTQADALIATGKLSKKTVESLNAFLEYLHGRDV